MQLNQQKLRVLGKG